MITKRVWRIASLVGILLITIIPVAVASGQVESDNTISFAGSGGYPPFNYITESGEVIGFDVDVATEIASRLGYEMKYVTTSWDGII
ncbi:MAG: transporter substrate-binding domain-containing protein, partial [Spirochaetia bacterium]|nr:transporter substrate-binding domain-containing protein [Spirochaetia bacterium]